MAQAARRAGARGRRTRGTGPDDGNVVAVAHARLAARTQLTRVSSRMGVPSSQARVFSSMPA